MNYQPDSKETINLRSARIQRRADGITEINIQTREALEPADVMDMISSVYRLNADRENALLLIQPGAAHKVSQETRLLLSRCSNIAAAVIVMKESFAQRISKIIFGNDSKKYPLRAFSDLNLGVRWLEQHDYTK